jgi:hypothetical protein
MIYRLSVLKNMTKRSALGGRGRKTPYSDGLRSSRAVAVPIPILEDVRRTCNLFRKKSLRDDGYSEKFSVIPCVYDSQIISVSRPPLFNFGDAVRSSPLWIFDGNLYDEKEIVEHGIINADIYIERGYVVGIMLCEPTNRVLSGWEYKVAWYEVPCADPSRLPYYSDHLEESLELDETQDFPRRHVLSSQQHGSECQGVVAQ